jgi:hypothetical protein
MARNNDTPYLRLVEMPQPTSWESARCDLDGSLLGFVDMSRVSDAAFETILSRVQPSFVFDLRPVPYFDIGRLNRRRVFDLFRTLRASYRDVAGALHITEHNDASLNSGAVGRVLLQMMASRPGSAPVMVLVDDDEVLEHARHVLPRYLGASLACALEVDLVSEDREPDVVARTDSGQFFVVQAKFFRDRPPVSPSMVEAFRLWFGDDMFAMTLMFDHGRAIQVALPIASAATLAQHLDLALSRCALPNDDVPSTTRTKKQTAHDHNPMHVVALHVEGICAQEARDGASIQVTFNHRNDETLAMFSLDDARQLRERLQLRGHQWAVWRSGADRASSVHATQREAIDRARAIISVEGDGTLTSHDRDGRMRDSDTSNPDDALSWPKHTE